MARIRTVKPELFKHEELYEVEEKTSLPIRLAFIGLLTCCDREGRFKWRPRALKLDVLPYDKVDFEEVLKALVVGGFVEQYEVGGDIFGWVPSFLTHQAINQREAQSSLPPRDLGRAIDVHVHARACTSDVSSYEYKGVNVAPALRNTILARDGNKCLRCGATEDLTADHIFPRCIGGTHAPANLRTLCRSCNSARPVAGQALLDDLARDGLTLDDMQRTCMHVQARVEGKGKEGKGSGKEEEGKENIVEPSLDPVPEIFAYWQKVMQSPNSVLDDKRKSLISKALKNYSPADICKAIRGCSKTPHNMGQNDRNEKYNGLNVILRDADHIDRFIRNDAGNARTTSETVDERNARVMAEFLGETDDENTIEMEHT